ncbi:MAG: protein kinase [Polyangiaceae bacterium]
MSLPLADRATERAQSRVGTTLRGKWKLERILGSGGMATVYEATHRNQARAAIKMLHPELALDSDVTARFLREGYVANSVDHPGTVKVLDDDVAEDGSPYLVMELLEGETVEDRMMRKGGTLPLAEVMALADSVLAILVASHAAGVVHRDLKPENLFLTRDGQLKILDYGIARLREINTERQQTRAGSLMGTPAFMAPEQARGRWAEVNERTDIWAVGATLFALITGRYVHETTTVQEQIIASATTPAPSLGSVAPNLPTSVVYAVDRALAFDNQDRFTSAAEMQDAILQASGDVVDAAPLSLPVPSAPEAPTLMASSSDDLEPPTLDTLNTLTNRPVARTADVPSPERRTNRFFVVTTLGLGAVVLVLLVAFARIGFSRTEPSAPHAETPKPAAPTTQLATAQDPDPISEKATPVKPSNEPAPATPSAKPVKPANVKPVVKPASHPTSKPAPAPTPSTTGKKPPSSSLFDKRW